MENDARSENATEQAGGEPAARTSAEPTSDQAMPAAGATAGQPDIPTLLIDTVAAVVLKQIKPLLDDLQKIKETGIPLPVVPEKAEVLELRPVNMDLVPGQITLPGNSGAPETEIPRILIDTVVAVVLKEFAPLLEDLQKIRDQGLSGLGSALPSGDGQQVLGDLLGRGAAGGVMDEKTMMASIRAREEQMKLRVQKFQERYEALRRSAAQKSGR